MKVRCMNTHTLRHSLIVQNCHACTHTHLHTQSYTHTYTHNHTHTPTHTLEQPQPCPTLTQTRHTYMHTTSRTQEYKYTLATKVLSLTGRPGLRPPQGGDGGRRCTILDNISEGITVKICAWAEGPEQSGGGAAPEERTQTNLIKDQRPWRNSCWGHRGDV